MTETQTDQIDLQHTLETIHLIITMRKELKLTKGSDPELKTTKRKMEKDIINLYNLIQISEDEINE